MASQPVSESMRRGQRSDRVMRLEVEGVGASDGRVSYALEMDGREERIWYRDLSGEALRPVLEAGITAGMVPAMMSGGGELVVSGEVDGTFLKNQETVQDICTVWHEPMERVKVVGAEAVERAACGTGRVGTFFTCGMDSYYTLLKHRDEITDLIYIYGLDVKLTDTEMREKKSANLRAAAEALGKNLIELESNVREVMDRYALWDLHGFGPPLAAAAHLLGGRMERAYIPGSFTYAQLIPWGSHPLLDPLWGGGAVEIVHDGCEASRPSKAKRVAGCPVALETLHVCWQNPDGVYNCGRCEKCIRTQLNLLAAGGLEGCSTFAESLRAGDIHRIRVTPTARQFLEENHAALIERGGHDDLAAVLRQVLDRPAWLTRALRWWRARERSVRKRLPFLKYDPHAPR